jgi:5'-deoxynucleotidase YfbR-like HD superfamily hydrolase
MNITIDELALLSQLTRWQNLPTVGKETVAEHTCQVALIVLKLSAEYSFDIGKALTIAVLHDVPEIWLTDIPFNVTKRFPQLKAAKESAEAQIVAEKLPEYEALLSKPCPELCFVKLADASQVIQFATAELKVSENEYLRAVLQEAEHTVDGLKSTLEQYKL